jgi:hypothetical protein
MSNARERSVARDRERLAWPSGCRDSAPKRGTRRHLTEPPGSGFSSDFRELSAKTACSLGFLERPLPDSILVSSTRFALFLAAAMKAGRRKAETEAETRLFGAVDGPLSPVLYLHGRHGPTLRSSPSGDGRSRRSAPVAFSENLIAEPPKGPEV